MLDIHELSLYRKMQKIGLAIGCDIKNPSPIDILAIQTVAYTKTKRKNKHSFFTCNDLAVCDLTIFNAFLLRFICVMSVRRTSKLENLTNEYINKVIKGIPKLDVLCQKYGTNILKERLDYYDIVASNIVHSHKENVFIDVADMVNTFIPEFVSVLKEILTYDYVSQKYISFLDNEPLLTLPVNLTIKLNTEIIAYIQSFPTVFGHSLAKAIEYMQ